MPSIARRVEFLYSNNSCMIFPDATPPICGVADTLGRHTCAALHALPRRALRRARNAFANATPDGRCRLLRRETANLRAATDYVEQVRKEVMAEAATVRSATADIERWREILLRQRERDEAEIARIMAQREGEDL